MAKDYRIAIPRALSTGLSRRGPGLMCVGVIFLFATSALARNLPLREAILLAAEHAPSVNTGTLLAFAYRESRLHPYAVHDNTTGQSVFPASAAEAANLTGARLAQGHNLDLGVMQVNSANLARTGLTVTTAFDAGESMRAGSLILTAAYRQCLRGNANPNGGEQQTALRCAASVYNTGREQAGILNGYQADVWRAAAQIVPAIQLNASGTLPSAPAAPKVVGAPEPRPPPPTALEDALHATATVPDVSGEMNDALHLASRKEAP